MASDGNVLCVISRAMPDYRPDNGFNLGRNPGSGTVLHSEETKTNSHSVGPSQEARMDSDTFRLAPTSPFKLRPPRTSSRQAPPRGPDMLRQTQTGPDKRRQARTGPSSPIQTRTGPDRPGQVRTGPNSSARPKQAKMVP